MKYAVRFEINETFYTVFPIIYIWRPPRLSELTPYWMLLGLTHLGSDTSIYTMVSFFHIQLPFSFLKFHSNIKNYISFVICFFVTIFFISKVRCINDLDIHGCRRLGVITRITKIVKITTLIAFIYHNYKVSFCFSYPFVILLLKQLRLFLTNRMDPAPLRHILRFWINIKDMNLNFHSIILIEKIIYIHITTMFLFTDNIMYNYSSKNNIYILWMSIINHYHLDISFKVNKFKIIRTLETMKFIGCRIVMQFSVIRLLLFGGLRGRVDLLRKTLVVLGVNSLFLESLHL